MPRVSVVLPTYRAEHLREALDSVFAQTYRDFEVVAVDDGAPDEARRLLASYGEGIRVLRHEHNRGCAAARNTAMAAARGELLAPLDDDDVWLPDKLERQVALLDARPEVQLLMGTVRVTNEAGGSCGFTHPHWEADAPAERRLGYADVVSGTFGCPSASILRRCLAARLGSFDETLPVAQDVDYWLRATALTRPLLSREVVARYRLYPGNRSGFGRPALEANLDVARKWRARPVPPGCGGALRRCYARARYQLAVLDLQSPRRRGAAAAGLVAAALADPLVDCGLPGRARGPAARAGQLLRPWLAAAACVAGLAAPLAERRRARRRS